MNFLKLKASLIYVADLNKKLLGIFLNTWCQSMCLKIVQFFTLLRRPTNTQRRSTHRAMNDGKTRFVSRQPRSRLRPREKACLDGFSLIIGYHICDVVHSANGVLKTVLTDTSGEKWSRDYFRISKLADQGTRFRKACRRLL